MVIVAICSALGLIGSNQALPYLEDVARHAPPQVDVFGHGCRSQHHTVRYAAAKALERLTGTRPQFKGEAALRPVDAGSQSVSASPERLLEWAGNTWIVEGGEWVLTDGAALLQGRGRGRLWLKTDLSREYKLYVEVLDARGRAGLTFGALKDYVPSHAEGGWLALTVSFSAVRGVTAEGGAQDQPLMLTWRSCAVASRADLGPRVGLFVDGVDARFQGFRLYPLHNRDDKADQRETGSENGER